MSEKRWVQHVSGQWRKWELKDCEENNDSYSVWKAVQGDGNFDLALPRSEYVLCGPPPEPQWVDVTGECQTSQHLLYEQCEVMGKRDVASVRDGYRLRKVLLDGKWFFTIEKKVPA